MRDPEEGVAVEGLCLDPASVPGPGSGLLHLRSLTSRKKNDPDPLSLSQPCNNYMHDEAYSSLSLFRQKFNLESHRQVTYSLETVVNRMDCEKKKKSWGAPASGVTHFHPTKTRGNSQGPRSHNETVNFSEIHVANSVPRLRTGQLSDVKPRPAQH